MALNQHHFPLLVLVFGLRLITKHVQAVDYYDAGDTAALSCNITLTGGLSIRTLQWRKVGLTPNDLVVDYFAGIMTPGSPAYTGRVDVNHTGFLLLSNVQQADEGTYICSSITLSDVSTQPGVQMELQIALAPAKPTISESSPVTVTEGDSRSLTCSVSNLGNPAATISWLQDGAALPSDSRFSVSSDGLTLTITGVQQGDAATYSCRAINIVGTMTSDGVEMVVQFPPVKPTLSDLSPVTVTEGDSRSLTCSVSNLGNPEATISWLQDGGSLPADSRFSVSADGLTLTITGVQQGDAATYSCRASNAAGTMTSDGVELVVNYPAENAAIIYNKPSNQHLESSSLECTCTASGVPAVNSFSWTKDGSTLPLGVSTTDGGAKLVFSSLDKVHTGTYTCSASNGIGAADTADVTITVRYAPKSTTVTASPSATRVEGESITLTCTADADPAATYTWVKVGGNLPSGGNVGADSLQISQLNRTDSGDYTCTAGNGINPDGQDTITVDVQYPPSVDTFSADSNPAEENTPVTLTCTVDSNPDPTAISIVRVGTGAVGDVTLATGQGRTLSHTIQDVSYINTGTYRCQADNGIGNTAIQDLELVANFAPKFTHQDVPYTAADGDTVNLTCSAIAEPAITAMQWIYKGQVLSTGGQFTITQRSAGVSVLTIADVMEDNYGMYNCTAENAKGLRWTSIALEAQGPPHSPANLKVVTKNPEGDVTIQWAAGFNGGLEAIHTVDFRKQGDKDWTSGDTVTQPVSENHINYRVFLQLGSQGNFTIRLRTINWAGSVPVVMVDVLIEDEAVLEGKLTVNQDFQADYNNLDSQRSQDFINEVMTGLDATMRQANLPGYRSSRVLSLSPGSVVADFEITVAKSEVQRAISAFDDKVQSGSLGSLSVMEGTLEERAPEGGDNTTVIIIAAVACVVVLLAIIGGGVFVFRRKSAKNKPGEIHTNIIELDREGGETNDGYQNLRIPQRQTSAHTYQGLMAGSQNETAPDGAYEDVKTPSEFPRNQLNIREEIGQGEFGSVYKAEALNLSGGESVTTVAVKEMKGMTSPTASTAFFKTLSVLKLLGSHPNVVSFLGCCTDAEPFYLLLEYVPGGSLQSILRSSRTQQTYGNLHGGSKSLSSRDLTSFAWDVAKGMSFLSVKKIIHRDLATRNVLVSADRTCKVSDFGFSREGDEYERTTKARLPVRWMAPESLFHRKYTTKTDVWAFGVLLWEIVTLGATPYLGMSKREVMDGVQQGYRMGKPKHCDEKLYNLMLNCWNADPARRPEFQKIQRTLDTMMETEHDYIILANLDENTYTSLQTASDEKY